MSLLVLWLVLGVLYTVIPTLTHLGLGAALLVVHLYIIIVAGGMGLHAFWRVLKRDRFRLGLSLGILGTYGVMTGWALATDGMTAHNTTLMVLGASVGIFLLAGLVLEWRERRWQQAEEKRQRQWQEDAYWSAKYDLWEGEQERLEQEQEEAEQRWHQEQQRAFWDDTQA